MTYAHSPNKHEDWQLLVDHARGVGTLADAFAAAFRCRRLGQLVGEIHDVGKCAQQWQTQLKAVANTGKRVGIDHKTLACNVAETLGLPELVLPLHGHHGGLTSPQEVRKARRRLAREHPDLLTEGEQALPGVADALGGWEWARELTLPWQEPMARELGLRMIFSALCDADSLDTEAHKKGLKAPRVRPETDFARLWNRFEERRMVKVAGRGASPMDGAREAVYRACVAAAPEEPGVYRLGAPTGTAKTFGSAAFALRHAIAHGKRRVVVALPWKTVTEQNAADYRALLEADGEKVVLEHHSGYIPEEGAGDEESWEKAAAENWDAPFIVTTTVRLFESLLGRSRSATQRLHRLADAVIVIDEVQGLPYKLLVPILDVLRGLVEHFGATVVLCSATQPAFWSLAPFEGLPVTEIVPDPAAMVAADGRVAIEYAPAEGRTLLEVADVAAEDDSVLMVVNTTGEAAAIARHWQEPREGEADPSVWHLSTRMAPVHRRQVIERVQERLRAGLPTHLVSTPLIEAGVNLDFPVGYRARCSIDAAVQVAGRVNRDGRLGQAGRLVVFDATDLKVLREARTGASLTDGLFWSRGIDATDPEVQRVYWEMLFKELQVAGPESAAAAIQKARAKLDYRAVVEGPLIDHQKGPRDPSKAFRMIPDDPIAVIIAAEELRGEDFDPWFADPIELGAEAALIARLSEPGEASKAMRELQPYLATLHTGIAQRPGVFGLLETVLGIPGAPGSVAVWRGGYSPLTGMEIEINVEDFVV